MLHKRDGYQLGPRQHNVRLRRPNPLRGGGREEGLDVGLRRDCSIVGRAEPVHDSGSRPDRGAFAAVRDLSGEDARGTDRPAEVEVGQLKHCRQGPRAWCVSVAA